MVSAKNILSPDLGPIGSLDSPVIKQIAQLSNPYSGVFSISRPTVYYLFFFLFYLGNENWEKLMSGTSPSSYKRRRSSESEVIRHYRGSPRLDPFSSHSKPYHYR